MYKLYVIGIDDLALNNKQEQLLLDCSHVFGTARFGNLVAGLDIDFQPITPLQNAFKQIKQALKSNNVAVFASGDPLFFGIGKRLTEEFSRENIEFYPALSSIQRGCALFKIAWDDARIVSLHGRDDQNTHLPSLLLQAQKNLAFTDKANSPDIIAGKLLSYLRLLGDKNLIDNIELLVAEDIGLEDEKVFRGSLSETHNRTFSPLNILCLLAPTLQNPTCTLGLNEDDIHHSRGLITKNEVRAATLHQLQLPATGVLWDVGAGSGSISIEAAKSNPQLTVYAIEHKPEEIENIKNNIVKFGCYNVIPIFGRAPEALSTLPDPDRIFVGGSSGSLDTIVKIGAERLPQGGRFVVNGVIAKTIDSAPKFLSENKFKYRASTIKVSRKDDSGNYTEYNPITIFAGSKQSL